MKLIILFLLRREAKMKPTVDSPKMNNSPSVLKIDKGETEN